MEFVPFEWKQGEAGGTPITAAQLNRIEQGIVDSYGVSEADPNTAVRRDGSGRARFADPSHAQDAATKWYVDTLAEHKGAGAGSVVLGFGASAEGNFATALGYNASAERSYTTALGGTASANGPGATVLGYNASAEGGDATALGYNASAEGGYTTALGGNASANGVGATVLGHNASANRGNATALGYNASAEGFYATALGYNASAANDDQGTLGRSSTSWTVPGSFTVSGTKNFEIPHPHPAKRDTHRLRHASVEAPTAGDTLYRYTVTATEDNETVTVQLPDYFPYLNTNVDVWVNGDGHFGRAYGTVDGDELRVTCEIAGDYKVLVIGTRNDDHPSVQDWHIRGVEREVGESWTGETYAFEVDEIIEVDEIMEVA